MPAASGRLAAAGQLAETDGGTRRVAVVVRMFSGGKVLSGR
ncbi:MAG TPA: hypothetical protein VE196_03515 [Pseudonocardiaceae bacterium]|nr:hypothetical protein [Pseudonocardiaceae bacterium]